MALRRGSRRVSPTRSRVAGVRVLQVQFDARAARRAPADTPSARCRRARCSRPSQALSFVRLREPRHRGATRPEPRARRRRPARTSRVTVGSIRPRRTVRRRHRRSRPHDAGTSKRWYTAAPSSSPVRASSGRRLPPPWCRPPCPVVRAPLVRRRARRPCRRARADGRRSHRRLGRCPRRPVGRSSARRWPDPPASPGAPVRWRVSAGLTRMVAGYARHNGRPTCEPRRPRSGTRARDVRGAGVRRSRRTPPGGAEGSPVRGNLSPSAPKSRPDTAELRGCIERRRPRRSWSPWRSPPSPAV